MGIEYATSKGSVEASNFILSQRPSIVFFESFAAEREVVSPGGVIHYKDALPGWRRAAAAVAQDSFRNAWTTEAIATLSALRVDSEIRFGDRMLSTSFDRLIARCGLDELRHALIEATEAVAAAIENSPSSASRVPQNALCPHFPELWQERHMLMATFAARAAEAAADDDDVAFVCGAEHVERIARCLAAGPLDSVAVDSLLSATSGAELTSPADASARKVLLEKRAAVAALLLSTNSFPPELVLPPADCLTKPDLAVVQECYPKYRAAFAQRIGQAFHSKSLRSGSHQQPNAPEVTGGPAAIGRDGPAPLNGLMQLNEAFGQP
jgi:hypothetical protein